MLIQIHILQNYSPANLNRDNTGAPKDAVFGGFRRGRISSQCIKRSIRRSDVFREAFASDNLLGVRTKSLPDLIAEQLDSLSVDPETRQAILARVPEIGRESGKPRERDEGEGDEQSDSEVETATAQLIFLAPNELRPMAETLVEICNRVGPKNFSNQKQIKIGDITKDLGNNAPRSVDIAMFGRMTTSAAFLNVQAAVQVAHALSTNALEQEFDYYTAVDDLSGQTGAGMIGDVEFNSSLYYKYLNVHWEGLVDNLGGDRAVAKRAVLALLEAVISAHPTGKQNSFAAFNPPDVTLVEVSPKNLPVSYTNAYLKPARGSQSCSLIEDAAAKLADYMQRAIYGYGLVADRAYFSLYPFRLPESQSVDTLADLHEWLASRLEW